LLVSWQIYIQLKSLGKNIHLVKENKVIEISFEINGKKVNPNNIKDALEAAFLNSVQESIRKSVGSVRCQEHGQSPKIKVKGRNLDTLSFEVVGCCEGLIEEAKRKLK